MLSLPDDTMVESYGSWLTGGNFLTICFMQNTNFMIFNFSIKYNIIKAVDIFYNKYTINSHKNNQVISAIFFSNHI